MEALYIYNRCAAILSDTNFTRWTKANMQNWLNDARRDLIILDPSASSAKTSVQLSTGTKQSLTTARALSLINISRNMGSDGTTAGRAPAKMDLTTMTTIFPEMDGLTATAEVLFFALDDNDRLAFHVIPPNLAQYVEAEYSVEPTAISAEGQDIGIPDRYVTPLVNLVLYRCFDQDTGAGSSTRARNFLNEAMQLLGLEEKAWSDKREELRA